MPSSWGAFLKVDGGVAFEWGSDDLDYAARYLMARGLPFTIKGPPEFRDALRSLAEEARRIVDDSQ